MNEPNPPISASQAKTSSLAVWSLVLGILSLFCFTIFSAIPGVICGHKALSQIKRSGGALAGQGFAIAGLVTGYLGISWAIVFIPMLAAIAIPNFIQARNVAMRNACARNLQQIERGKTAWAAANQKGADDVPTEADLNSYLPRGFESLKCPAGGTYSINAVGEEPTCTIEGHSAFNTDVRRPAVRRL